MKSTLLFASCFIAFTIIGTLTHELGHYFAGKSLGLSCTLHYQYCRCLSYEKEERLAYGKALFKQYGTRDSIPQELLDHYQYLTDQEPDVNRLWLIIGGPLQTITTGLIGFGLLLRRRKFHALLFNRTDWLLVFLSLFWLRQPFNLLMAITSKVLLRNESFFGTGNDEVKIARELNIWDGAVSISTAIIGLAISLYVIFKIVPQPSRSKFILGGLIGGILGFILWMYILGPLILP